jgi:NAD(P)-dependent dehydrogenase (short-subunit alcohol dehydrogenase family)
MALTRQPVVELGADGVRVNYVAPGVVLSGRARRLMVAIGTDRGPEGMASAVPLRRFATVDELAGLVVALCTDETSCMTGVTLDVDGAAYIAGSRNGARAGHGGVGWSTGTGAGVSW